jgi:hypothetical protein
MFAGSIDKVDGKSSVCSERCRVEGEDHSLAMDHGHTPKSHDELYPPSYDLEKH